MKKLFLLIPALALTLLANAATHEIGSGTSNILGSTVASAADGDVIVLTDNGPYVNVKGSDDYTKLEKNLTIQAAEGKNPVIQYEVPFRSKLGKTVKFIGITFDGTSLTGYDFYFRFYDANDNNLEFEDCEFRNISKYVFDVYTAFKANSLKLTNCKLHDNSSRGILNRGTLKSLEINGGQIYNFTGNPVLDNYGGATLGKVKINGTEFYGNTQDIISGTATSHADSCIINNCYFHNNTRSAVYFAASSVSGVETCDGVIVKNSTFADNDLSASSRSVIDVFNYGETEASNIEVTVDHCTFYNNTTKNFDYSCIRSRKSTKVSITNSIFAYPSAIDFYATNCYGGTISNTLVYNLNYGHRSSGGAPALTNTITGDPLFVNTTTGYAIKGDWSTGEVSPARAAATDGSDLGDPRWYSAETLPNVNFATPHTLDGLHAQLSGSFALNGDDNIQSQDKAYAGIAKWKIHATRKCMVEVTLNIAAANTSGHRYEVALYDANNALVGTALAEPADSWSAGDKVLGIYEIPAAGDYTIKLTNDCNNSSTIIEGVTFAYTGGAVQNIAIDANTTLNVADAWFSGCTRTSDYIQYPSSGTSSAWIKWNIATSETKYYDLTVNINTTYNHGFTVAVYEDEEAEPVASVTEGSYVETQGAVAIEIGRINLAGGKNYVVKVTNAPSGSQAKVLNVVFAPVVATATELPATLAFNDAVLSEKAFVQDGMLYFNTIGDTNPQGQWAQWEVTTDHNGKFLFTLNATSENGQKYKITILDSGNNELDSYEENFESGDVTMKHFFELAAGTYYVKVENTRSYSKGHLTSLVVTEPAVITLDEAATDISAIIEANYNQGAKHYQLKRTLQSGMYNTFCSPLYLPSNVCKAVFGEDVEIYTLKEAIVNGAVLNVELKSSSDIWQGTPVFIKPSHNIVNPIFIDVEMKAEAPASTTKTNANFVGTFVKTTLTGGENILYLGPDNTLYYPEIDTPIKGMRGWFAIHDAPVAAPMIKHMRIVENANVATEINLVGAENKTIKTIENGQLIITIDGVRYNVMGVKIQ